MRAALQLLAQHLAPLPRVLVALQLLARTILLACSPQTMQPLNPPLPQATVLLLPQATVLVLLLLLTMQPLNSLLLLLVLPLFQSRLTAHGVEGDSFHTCLLGTWLRTGCSRTRANE